MSALCTSPKGLTVWKPEPPGCVYSILSLIYTLKVETSKIILFLLTRKQQAVTVIASLFRVSLNVMFHDKMFVFIDKITSPVRHYPRSWWWNMVTAEWIRKEKYDVIVIVTPPDPSRVISIYLIKIVFAVLYTVFTV